MIDRWIPHSTALALGLTILGGCTARIGGSDARIEREFFAHVARDVETGVAGLNARARNELADYLPMMRRQDTWDDVLDVLDEHPRLDPFEDAIRNSIRRHSDGRTQLEIAAGSGQRRLRDLILSTIDNALGERAPERP